MGNLIKEIKINILDTLKNLKEQNIKYIKETYKETKFRIVKDIENWGNRILKFIIENFNLKYNEIQKYLNDIETNFVDKTEKDEMQNKIQNFNVFTSKDIQNYYSEIIDYFKRYSTNYIDDDDEPENKTVGEFLEKVANIFRKSYNDSNKFLELLYDKFNNIKNKSETIISSVDQFKMEFSSWVKNNKQFMENNLEYFIKERNIDKYINEQKEQNKKNYLEKLYKDLLTLYFQCELSFPSIIINFKKEEEYDFSKMEDLAYNTGKGKKQINFVVFPSLISNEEFLKKGKQYVFTYFDNKKKKTFYFEKINLEPLIEENKKFYIPGLKDELKINFIKILIPEINYKISEKVKTEYKFLLKNKKTGEKKEETKNSLIKIGKDEEFIKCDFYLMSEYILTFKREKEDNGINK